jgi:hypothetical protein
MGITREEFRREYNLNSFSFYFIDLTLPSPCERGGYADFKYLSSIYSYSISIVLLEELKEAITCLACFICLPSPFFTRRGQGEVLLFL